MEENYGTFVGRVERKVVLKSIAQEQRLVRDAALYVVAHTEKVDRYQNCVQVQCTLSRNDAKVNQHGYGLILGQFTALLKDFFAEKQRNLSLQFN